MRTSMFHSVALLGACLAFNPQFLEAASTTRVPVPVTTHRNVKIESPTVIIAPNSIPETIRITSGKASITIPAEPAAETASIESEPVPTTQHKVPATIALGSESLAETVKVTNGESPATFTDPAPVATTISFESVQPTQFEASVTEAPSIEETLSHEVSPATLVEELPTDSPFQPTESLTPTESTEPSTTDLFPTISPSVIPDNTSCVRWGCFREFCVAGGSLEDPDCTDSEFHDGDWTQCFEESDCGHFEERGGCGWNLAREGLEECFEAARGGKESEPKRNPGGRKARPVTSHVGPTSIPLMNSKQNTDGMETKGGKRVEATGTTRAKEATHVAKETNFAPDGSPDVLSSISPTSIAHTANPRATNTTPTRATRWAVNTRISASPDPMAPTPSTDTPAAGENIASSAQTNSSRWFGLHVVGLIWVVAAIMVA